MFSSLFSLFLFMFTPFALAIVGGGVVGSNNVYPWVATLKVNGVVTCGGSLISSKFILTSAHCSVDKTKPAASMTQISDMSSLSASVWKYDQNLGAQQEGSVTFTVGKVHLHPELDLHTELNDVALWEVTISENPSKRTLVTASLNRKPQAPDPGALDVVGWGLVNKPSFSKETGTKGTLSQYMKHIQVHPITNAQCQSILGQKRQNMVSNQIMCTVETQSVGVCNADSGGPLFKIVSGKPIIYGIGNGVVDNDCGMVGKPSLFTRIAEFAVWIDSVIV